MIWHSVIERVIDRHPVAVKLVRPGSGNDENTSVEISIAAVQYQETTESSGGSVVQQVARWIIPARRLVESGFPVPPRPGDYLVFGSGPQRMTIVAPGYAGGDVVRWDVTSEGAPR